MNQFTKKRKAKGPPLWSLGRAGEMFKNEEAKITLQRKSKGPTNIDILNVGDECNQNCRQCYYKSEDNLTGISLTGEIEFIENIEDSG